MFSASQLFIVPPSSSQTVCSEDNFGKRNDCEKYSETEWYIVMRRSPFFDKGESQYVHKSIWTANSSALLEWRNKLIQHYMADREDESSHGGTSRILIAPRGPWNRLKYERVAGRRYPSHGDCLSGPPYCGPVLFECLRWSCLLPKLGWHPWQTSAAWRHPSHFHGVSVITLKQSGTDTFSREWRSFSNRFFWLLLRIGL